MRIRIDRGFIAQSILAKARTGWEFFLVEGNEKDASFFSFRLEVV
jgi:hypothetical protein